MPGVKKLASLRNAKPRRGNCYVTCEALFYLLGGKKAGYVPHVLRHEGDTHWYLVLRVKTTPLPCQPCKEHPAFQTVIIDPTADQFRTPPPYHLGRGCGFLPKGPSKRAKVLMQTLTWQNA